MQAEATKRRLSRVPAVLAVTLVVAGAGAVTSGCGDDGDDGEPPPVDGPTDAPPPPVDARIDAFEPPPFD